MWDHSVLVVLLSYTCIFQKFSLSIAVCRCQWAWNLIVQHFNVYMGFLDVICDCFHIVEACNPEKSTCVLFYFWTRMIWIRTWCLTFCFKGSICHEITIVQHYRSKGSVIEPLQNVELLVFDVFFWFFISMFECFEDLMDYRSLLILSPSSPNLRAGACFVYIWSCIQDISWLDQSTFLRGIRDLRDLVIRKHFGRPGCSIWV